MYDKRAYELEWKLLEDTERNNTLRPAQDPTNAGIMHKLDTEKTFTIEFGIVVQSMPYVHNYKVLLENCKTPIWCSTLMDTGGSLIGARSLTTIPEAAQVLVTRHPSIRNFGYILGVMPAAIRANIQGLSDYISQTSCSGVAVDSGYSFPYTLPYSSGLENRSAGRPVDSIPIGDWGAITETGTKVFIDPFMAQIGIDEETNLSIFYHNQLARLSGHNLELKAAGHEHTFIDDQCEVVEEEFDTPYYWEALGVYVYGTEGNRDYTPNESQIDSPEYAVLEPAYDDQQPIYRRQSYGGYLGQGGKRIVSIPDPHKRSLEDIEQYSIESNHLGVFFEDIELTGRYSLRSAKAISITKRPSIPVPKRMKLPSDETGDNETNYKAAGIIGAGDAHEVVDEMICETDIPGPSRAANILDMHALIYNKEAVLPFDVHTKDWYVPEEEVIVELNGKNLYTPDYENFDTEKQFLDEPEFQSHVVDHRYGPTKYYEGEAGIDITEDGSVVITDAYNSEITMTGGNITFSAAGNIFLRSGKSVITLAGNDIIAKAENNVEVSSSEQHVRIKAERNILMLSGNSGCGGILLQSKAVCPVYVTGGDPDEHVLSGVTITCDKSNFNVLSHNSILTTKDGDLSFIATGKHIKFESDYFDRKITKAAIDAIGGIVNEYWSDHAIIASQLWVGGPSIVDGTLVVNGAAAFAGGLSAVQFTTLDDGVSAIQSIISDVYRTRESYLKSEVNVIFDHTALLDSGWKMASFNFKGDYGGVVILESRWQQVARLTGQVIPKWVETSVLDVNSGEVTYPYPGDSAFKCYYLINPLMFDVDTGSSTTKLAGLLDDGSINPLHAIAFDGNYMVIEGDY